ncbi:MAG: DNA/RNA nuclease SfsA [Proteobacteria bacterium]|nr:DNA/RNA nuclease SfsA [Pseudomonadota bacterium]
MKYPEPLLKARLIKRYKRFLADVILDDGTEMTIHTANTGSMNGCAIPGSTIWISNSHNPKRKYLYSWEISSTEHGKLIGINTILANKLAKEAIEKGFISELSDVSEIATEVPYGAEKSRIDLLVRQKNGQKCYVEVKNVTASFEQGVAAFPDAVTARGTKHLRELELMVRQGHRAIIFYCVQRDDVKQVRVADEIDSLYAKTLAQVQEKGVEVLAYGARFSGDSSPDGIFLTKKLLFL